MFYAIYFLLYLNVQVIFVWLWGVGYLFGKYVGVAFCFQGDFVFYFKDVFGILCDLFCYE